jgi:hypothetical protein
MNGTAPIEYLSSFAQTSQALMLHLAAPLLTAGSDGADFTRYAEVAMAQQGYLQRMGALWLSTVASSGADAPSVAGKGDKRFTGEEWQKSRLHQFLKESYLINAHIGGKTTQLATPIDLAAIDVPVCVLASREDHIVPWQTAYRTVGLVSGDVRFTLAASGHIAGVINPASRNKRSFWNSVSGRTSGSRRRRKSREAGGSIGVRG